MDFDEVRYSEKLAADFETLRQIAEDNGGDSAYYAEKARLWRERAALLRAAQDSGKLIIAHIG